MIVGVENVLLKFGVAGNVDLRHALHLDVVHILHWIESMILRRDIDIVDVEQDAAVGGVHDFV